MRLPWQRPRFTPPGGPRPARLGFIALLETPKIDAALDAAREACSGQGSDPAASAAWDSLEIDVRARAADGGRLGDILAGRAGMTLAQLSEAAQHDIARATRYVTISATHPDPAALHILQAALGCARALADEGDLIAWLDVSTARWWLPDEITALAPQRRFELDEHIQIVVEAAERRPGHGHVVRSRGLDKLARPDVAARAPRRDAALLSEVVRDLARLLAEGVLIEPGDKLTVRDLPPLTVVAVGPDTLAPALAASAPVFELRDVRPDGGPDDGCPALIAALKPRPRLKVLR
ncbi:MAG: hypothetical protein IT370_09270 [Deltaproteobacteria bacterium]|nr:hypothetical protein [Deltaproteobacteria bacterium]